MYNETQSRSQSKGQLATGLNHLHNDIVFSPSTLVCVFLSALRGCSRHSDGTRHRPAPGLQLRVLRQPIVRVCVVHSQESFHISHGGGSLQEANQLTGLFIEYGPTVQIRSSESRVWRDGKRRKSNYYDGPLAVMINRLSASASEIFAGAIQDYGRGIIVGEQSFGKGTVQSLVALQEGQLKITESKFYRISGESTQHRGVLPDILFPSLFDPTQIGESALDNALAWDQIAPARFNRYNDYRSILPTLTRLHQKRAANDPDYLYLEDRVAMAQEAREITALPLMQSGRLAMRDGQEEKALEIENKRRVAKGLEPLASLDGDEDDTVLERDEEESARDEEEAEPAPAEQDADVLLMETGRILVDAMTLRPDTDIARRGTPGAY